jgi:hypothetical protein
MEDILDGMDDLQHEEEVEEMRASQQAASQAPPPPPPPSRRQPLAERQLDDTDLLGIDTTLAEAAKQVEDADTTEGIEGGDEGDVTRQADFEVHGDYGANVPGDVNVPENEMGNITTDPADNTAGEEGGVDTTGPVDELDEEDDGLPPTQHPGDADSRVSPCSGIRTIADK